MLDFDDKNMRIIKTFLLGFGLLLTTCCSAPQTLSLGLSASTIDTTSNTTSDTVVNSPSENSVIASSETVKSASTAGPSAAENLDATRNSLVSEQFHQLVQWQDKCYQKPSVCRVDEFMIVGTKYHQALDEQMTLYAKNNINSRLGHGKREVAIESIIFDDAALVAQVNACIYDTAILYMDGFIFNNHITSSHTQWKLQWDNPRWKWIDFQILHREYNTNICQAQQ